MNGKERLNVPCKLSSSFGELKGKVGDDFLEHSGVFSCAERFLDLGSDRRPSLPSEAHLQGEGAISPCTTARLRSMQQPRDVDTLQAAGVKSGDKMMLMKSPSAAKDTAIEE